MEDVSVMRHVLSTAAVHSIKFKCSRGFGGRLLCRRRRRCCCCDCFADIGACSCFVNCVGVVSDGEGSEPNV